MFDASTGTEEFWVVDGLGGQFLCSRRSGYGLMCSDNCSGKACLLLSKHQRFVGCGKDEGWVKEAFQGLVDVYAR